MFLALSENLTNDEFFSYGWRIPFLASAALVLVGLYVRLTITETPVFREALTRGERVKVPIVVVFRDYPRALVIGIMVSLATFVLIRGFSPWHFACSQAGPWAHAFQTARQLSRTRRALPCTRPRSSSPVPAQCSLS